MNSYRCTFILPVFVFFLVYLKKKNNIKRVSSGTIIYSVLVLLYILHNEATSKVCGNHIYENCYFYLHRIMLRYLLICLEKLFIEYLVKSIREYILHVNKSYVEKQWERYLVHDMLGAYSRSTTGNPLSTISSLYILMTNTSRQVMRIKDLIN